MKVTANNITEVLLALIALAGEIPKDITINEVSEKTLQNQISKSKKAGLLKIDANHNRIRLKSPKGLAALKEYSEELYLHYNMVSNNHKFQTSKKALLSQQQFSSTVIMMLMNGYEIDNLSIRHKSNHFGKNEDEKDGIDLVLGDGLLGIGMDKFAADGNIIPLIDSASLLTKSERRFYTSKYLKLGEPINDRINVSRLTGTMLSGGNLYNVYNIEDGSRIFKSAEIDMNNKVRNIYMSAYGKTLREFEAIIIIKQIPTRMDRLEEIFSHYYFIQDSRYGAFTLEILSQENWKQKLQEALYGEISPSPRFDGAVGDIPSWELLSCEYSKIQKLKKIAGDNPVHFVIFEWQIPIVTQFARGMNFSFQVLTEGQEQELLRELLKE